jgi:hypothetical protein
MKNKLKNELTLGDLMAATYQVWGTDQAARMLRFALNSRLVVVRNQPPLAITSSKGRSV